MVRSSEREVLDQVAQHGVGQAVLVGPLGVAEDAVELVGVGGLDGPQGVLEGAADVLGDLPHLAPVGLRRDLEAVVLREGGELRVTAGLRQRRLGLLVEDVAQALVEQQREDELLVVAGVDGAAQEHGRAPEVGFELLLGDAGASCQQPLPLEQADRAGPRRRRRRQRSCCKRCHGLVHRQHFLLDLAARRSAGCSGCSRWRRSRRA